MTFTVPNFKTKFRRFVSFSQALLLGTTSLLLINTSAKATDIVDIKYKDTELSIKTKELKKFSQTGEIPPHLQQFFDDTEQVPDFLSGLLAKEIYLSRSLVNDVLDSTTGQFFLLKLNQTINTSSSTEDLEDLKKTIIKAYNNDRELSVLELLDKYPQRRLKVDLTNLEGTYNDASNFTERILPAWEIAKSFLEDVVCDCEAQ
ncbi:MAG: alpha/beta hydrolase [Xenococcaceae cyanobacterium MO_188.B29]|nr:alpha/beta hydrolase [Xenococcaceae cyanobacterium MO_188.B29]